MAEYGGCLHFLKDSSSLIIRPFFLFLFSSSFVAPLASVTWQQRGLHPNGEGSTGMIHLLLVLTHSILPRILIRRGIPPPSLEGAYQINWSWLVVLNQTQRAAEFLDPSSPFYGALVAHHRLAYVQTCIYVCMSYFLFQDDLDYKQMFVRTSSNTRSHSVPTRKVSAVEVSAHRPSSCYSWKSVLQWTECLKASQENPCSMLCCCFLPVRDNRVCCQRSPCWRIVGFIRPGRLPSLSVFYSTSWAWWLHLDWLHCFQWLLLWHRMWS